MRRDGLRLTTGEAERTAATFAVLDATGAVSAAWRAEGAPLLAVLAPLTAEIAAADRRLTALAATDAAVPRLTTAPGIGPVTATAFVATFDDVTRFHDAHQVMAYLGLACREPCRASAAPASASSAAASPRPGARAGAGCAWRLVGWHRRYATIRAMNSETPWCMLVA